MTPQPLPVGTVQLFTHGVQSAQNPHGPASSQSVKLIPQSVGRNGFLLKRTFRASGARSSVLAWAKFMCTLFGHSVRIVGNRVWTRDANGHKLTVVWPATLPSDFRSRTGAVLGFGRQQPFGRMPNKTRPNRLVSRLPATLSIHFRTVLVGLGGGDDDGVSN